MIKLNLGSGTEQKEPGWTNVDIRKLPNVDVVSDLRKLPYEDESVDAIKSNYAIEHFPRKDIKPLVKEWMRVLKPGGEIEITTADWERMLDRWRDIEWETLLDGLYGAQNYEPLS